MEVCGMLTILVYLFGLVFLAVGILGFVPAASPNEMLLGIFHVNLIHNLIHIVTGVIALAVGFGRCSCCSPRRFFQVFGIIYGLVAILGFWYGDAPILGLVANNMADSVLHSVIAVVSLYLGFGCCCKSS